MNHLITHNPDDWQKAILSATDSKYYVHLKIGYLQLYNYRILYFRPILVESRYIALLIFPTGLQRQIFSQYHTGRRGGHV